MGLLDDFAKALKSPSSHPNAPKADIGELVESVHSGVCIGISTGIQEDRTGLEICKLPKRGELTLKDYYVLDVETTGLDRQEDRIIEIAWLKVQDGTVIDSFTTLVNPECRIPPSASRVNGICDKDVAKSPKYKDIRERVKSELIGATVVGHNVTFDLDFVKCLLNEAEGQITYADTLTLARRAFPGLSSYKLENLCKSLNLSQQSSHRALQDVASTKELLEVCVAELKQKDAAEKAKKKAEKETAQKERQRQFGKSPLFDVSFVFTGEFGMDRIAMEELARSVGALTKSAVTSKTDYLVVGKIANLPEWARERKLGKADELIAKGCKVKKISKVQYLDMIAQAERALRM